MSNHKERNSAIDAALIAHKLPHDTPSQLADAFRNGWKAAQTDAEPVDNTPCNESLAEDIEFLDTRYRGDPNYEHDAYYMRAAAAKLVRSGYPLYTHPPKQANQWQPIKTAPKTSKAILVYWQQGVRMAVEAIRSMLKITHRQFIDRISKRPDFPRPCLVLSQKNKRWNAADIQNWQEKKAKELSR